MSDARSARSGRTCHTRSEAAASTTSSVRSEARRRAALSKLRAEQGQRAAAAKAELARQQAEHAQQQARQQAEHAQKQAEQAAEQARQQAELARQQAELEAQELKDEADRNQLELALLEEEENAFLSADDAVPPIRLTAVAPVQPAGQLCQPPPLSDDAAARTRDWISGLGLQTQPAGATPSYVQQQPENRRPSEPVPPQTAPRLPRLTLEKFSGSALEWPRWIALFKALVHDRSDLSDIERLTYLQAHLTGPAKEAVRGMLCDAGLYSVALQDLEREFGDPSRVVQATLRKLLSTRQVRDGELSALADLSRDLHTAVSVLLSLHYDADLIATTNVTTVAGKLPAGLAWRWGEHVVERDITRPTLVDLDEWLRRQVAVGRVTVTQTGHKQPAKVEVSTAEGRPRRFATASAPTAGRAINSVMTAAIKPRAAASRGDCVICQQTHDIQSCDKFAALTVDDRAALAGRDGLCFNCLGRGHVSAKCPSDVRCGVEHCGKRHHTLLHNSKPVFPRRNDAGKVLTPSDSKLVGTAAAEPRGQVLLQVAPITVHGPAGSQTTHALLDLGSQVTLVTDDLCDRLGISGPANDLLLTTVNGKERLRSRRVTLSIQANGEIHEIRDAQTTPTINVTNHALDSYDEANWPHLADVQLPSETRGPVEVLLGADMFELIVPREVVEGPAGTPCAVRTLLGWTVTGRSRQWTANGTEGQAHAAAATPSRHKRGAATICAAVGAEPDRPPPAARRKLLLSATNGDVTTETGRKQQAMIRPPTKQLRLLREDQCSTDNPSRSPVPSVTSALQRRNQRSQLRRRFQPPSPPPTPYRRQRWHRASWRTSTTTTTHGTPHASVTRGGPPVCGHNATLTCGYAVTSCRTSVAGGSGDETTGPGPPGLRAVPLPSPRVGRCQKRSEHF